MTGGTGGVCPLQGVGSGYSTDSRTVASAVNNAITLDASTANLPSGYYNGYRWVIIICGNNVHGNNVHHHIRQ